MHPREVSETLTSLFRQDSRSLVLFLQGQPGIGKTACVGQAAASVGKELRTFPLPTLESVDLRGLPTVVNGITKWASPLPKDGQGILLLDELSSAAPDVQVAAHHLVHAEPGSDMSLPAGWHLVLTGNRASDKTHYRATSAPLRNRLVTITVEPDVTQWAEWALDNSISPTVVGFLRWRPELLIAKDIPGEGAFPSPRSWEATSNILNLNVASPTIEKELLLGTVGEGATIEFAAYLQTSRDLPRIEAILEAQSKVPVPKSPAQLYALVTSLAQYTREHGKSAITYVKRMPKEFALLYIMDVRRGGYDIRKDKGIGEWIGENANLFETGVGVAA